MKKKDSILWGEEILRAGHNLRMTTVGFSMFPSIRSGDILIIRPTRVPEIMIGDITVHRDGQRLVAHRLIKKKKVDSSLFFITKGDYLSYLDPPISASQLLGKVVSIERESNIIRFDTYFQRHWSRVLALTSPWLPLLIKRAYSLIRVAKRIAMAPVRILRACVRSPLRIQRKRLSHRHRCEERSNHTEKSKKICARKACGHSPASHRAEIL